VFIVALVLMFDQDFRQKIADFSITNSNPHFQIGRECPDQLNDSSRVLMCHATLNVDELIASRAYSNRNPESKFLVDEFEQ